MDIAKEDTHVEWNIRRVVETDSDEVFGLASELATSFPPDREAFSKIFRDVIADESAWLIVAAYGRELVGYCLGFDHVAFYANGRVAWVEEILVKSKWRRSGVGRALMENFEDWARSRGAKLVSLATRRAAPFYQAIGYNESAVYYRKLLS
jgi:GNAT superfamily N-acetyltransferase